MCLHLIQKVKVEKETFTKGILHGFSMVCIGNLEQDLADRFGISCSTVSRVFTTWINYLYLMFKELQLWPPPEIIQGSMPKVFYPMTRVVIKCY